MTSIYQKKISGEDQIINAEQMSLFTFIVSTK